MEARQIPISDSAALTLFGLTPGGAEARALIQHFKTLEARAKQYMRLQLRPADFRTAATVAQAAAAAQAILTKMGACAESAVPNPLHAK
ncbi:hypothetical protein [Bordetella genomosp. 9]|uniref:Uncharacterized protein n=1 Tax=Bordetella genomosp. 9 TaxID=1416803 RepID=A0A1W6YXF3_9BORD|nr:hypothetical protein [Bordetella genomosp. 9]ARP85644.1 hypothetical protein CAL13_05045 [Bordetella genomosp. 9]